tara:strand:+ start:1999 stop:2742 length:744 start_codon:yes stop_codon:yes gene_type:complete
MAVKSALANRRILVIGGSSGIGLATAYAAAQQGARVAIAGRDAARLKAAADRIGENVETYRVDISKEGRAKQLFSRVGKLDHLILTAADGVFKPFLDTDRADFSGAIDSKLWGSYNTVRYGVPCLKRRGSVTLTSGCAAHKPLEGLSPFATANGAIEAMCKTLAFELAPIRINTISPGIIETPVFDGMPKADRTALFRSVGRAVSIGRVGRADELAEAYLYLMTNTYTTGVVLEVDGGAKLARKPLW